jgi:hypothetical protein
MGLVKYVAWCELWSFQYHDQRFAYRHYVADCDEERAPKCECRRVCTFESSDYDGGNDDCL